MVGGNLNSLSYLDSPVFLRDLGREPIEITSGQGPYLYDSDGRRYLDAASGAAVACLGHWNEEMAQHRARQAARLAFAHPSQYGTHGSVELAEEHISRAPAPFTRWLHASASSADR